MDHEEFVIAVHNYIALGAVNEAMENLSTPPGRYPSAEAIHLSESFNKLPQEAKDICKSAASDAVNAALFGLFCVLDGVRNIDATINSSRLRLLLETDSEKVVLSDNTESSGLHDIYNSISK